MNVLCDGICNIQDIYNIENSDWNKDMFLQETILERLGVGAEDYEYFLFYEEYKRWIDRHQILHSHNCKNTHPADGLLPGISQK